MQCGAGRGLFNHNRWECRGGDASPGWECCSTARQPGAAGLASAKWCNSGVRSLVSCLIGQSQTPAYLSFHISNYDTTPNNGFLLARGGCETFDAFAWSLGIMNAREIFLELEILCENSLKDVGY